MMYLLFSMRMHEPDVGSIVTSIKGPNMVYHSKENISGERKAQCWTFISEKILEMKTRMLNFDLKILMCIIQKFLELKTPWLNFCYISFMKIFNNQ